MSAPLSDFLPKNPVFPGFDSQKEKISPPRDPFLEQAQVVDALLTQAARHDDARKKYEAALRQRQALLLAESDSRFFLKIMEPLCQFAGCSASADIASYQALLINAQQTLAHLLKNRPAAMQPEPLPVLKKCPPTRGLLHYMVRAALNPKLCSDDTFHALTQPLQHFLSDPSTEHYEQEALHVQAQLALLQDALDRQEALSYVLPVAQDIAAGSPDSPEKWYLDMIQRARALFLSPWASSRGILFLYIDYAPALPEKHRVQFVHRDGMPYPGLFLFPAGKTNVADAIILIPGGFH